jgi:hypothetical protein
MCTHVGPRWIVFWVVVVWIWGGVSPWSCKWWVCDWHIKKHGKTHDLLLCLFCCLNIMSRIMAAPWSFVFCLLCCLEILSVAILSCSLGIFRRCHSVSLLLGGLPLIVVIFVKWYVVSSWAAWFKMLTLFQKCLPLKSSTILLQKG